MASQVQDNASRIASLGEQDLQDNMDMDGFVEYYLGLFKQARDITKKCLDKTAEGAKELKIITSLRRTCAGNLKGIILRNYVPSEAEIGDIEDNEKLPSRLYKLVEEGMDRDGNPYREIICPLLESAVIRKSDTASGWQCESFIEDQEKCDICKYRPESQ